MHKYLEELERHRNALFIAKFTAWERMQIAAWLARCAGPRRNPARAAWIACRYGETLARALREVRILRDPETRGPLMSENDTKPTLTPPTEGV
ncbi:MAG: hypothetical protein P1V51_20160 [Deltaproteobacteria bacterium]|nr:hypothetical protein [Deltaproteobacteria bacterium]